MSPAPAGYHYEWAEDRDWRLITPKDGERRCRFMTVGKRCGRPAVAAFLRGTRRVTWWFYCGDHLYGRRIRDGRIEGWVAVQDEVPA